MFFFCGINIEMCSYHACGVTLQECKAMVTQEWSWQESTQQSARHPQSCSHSWAVTWQQVWCGASRIAVNWAANTAYDVTRHFLAHQTRCGLQIMVTRWVQEDQRRCGGVDNWQWLWYSRATACCWQQHGTVAIALDFILTSLLLVLSWYDLTSFWLVVCCHFNRNFLSRLSCIDIVTRYVCIAAGGWINWGIVW